MRVVIDPNVWISGLINPFGTPARVIEAVMADKVVAVVSQHLLDELTAVLLRPKFRRWVSLADAVAFVEALAGHADLHPDPGVVVGSPRLRDPDDDYLVALAATSDAVIVSGDADLLEAGLTPPAITPLELLTRIG